MAESKVIQLFPIPLYKGKINFDENCCDFLINQKYTRMKSGNGDYSENHYILDMPECKLLKKEVMTHVDVFTRKYLNVSYDTNFYMQNSWAVKHSPNDWAQNHIHCNCVLSGVFYLKTNKKSGDITFLKPEGYTNLFHTSAKPNFFESGNHNCDWWNEAPEIGDIFIFPSHLMHHVRKNDSNEDRYSVAFNINFSGIFKSDDSMLDYLEIEEKKPNE